MLLFGYPFLNFIKSHKYAQNKKDVNALLIYIRRNSEKMISLSFCVEVLRPSQQLWSCQAGQLPINTVPGQT